MSAPLTALTPAALVGGLRSTLLETLRPLLTGITNYALIDAPNYPNVGDSAIYLGQLACLAELGLPSPRFVCDFLTYDRGALAGAIGTGPILLTGGGSFGDLWPTAQSCREEILRSFPRNKIIQLPQTMFFRNPDAIRRARGPVGDHRDFTLLVRDRESAALARGEFGITATLCPDMAFGLGVLPRSGPPGRPILCLLRNDQSSASVGLPTMPDDCHQVDWAEGEPGTMLRALSYRLIGAVRRPALAPVFRPALMALYPRLARERFRRGCALLGSAKVVVTDRLHGHILSLLHGVPHVIVGDRFDKVSRFRAAWTEGVSGVWSAESAAAAIDVAREIIGGRPAREAHP